MPQTKKHHYVPRFLLSHFANEREAIDVFQFSKDRFRPSVGFKSQCQEKNFYGNDGVLEDAFQKLESPASSIIKKMIAGDLTKIEFDDLQLLRHFMLYQTARTKIAAKEAAALLNSSMMGYLKTVPMLQKIERELGPDFDPAIFDQGYFKIEAPQFAALEVAINSIPAFLDLDMKILISKGDVNFIISDGPVVRCNQFAEFKTNNFGKGGTRGYAVKGLQVFMPISPRLCIALYDGDTYRCGSPKKPWVQIGKKDCILLNCLQALHADECLYKATDGPSLDELRSYVQFRNEQIGTFMPSTTLSQEYSKGNGKMGQLIMTSIPDAFTYRQFSFMEVSEQNPYARYEFLPPRSSRLVQDMQKHQSEIKVKHSALSQLSKD